ncbi:MAG: aspartate aminotransferase family protein [Leptospiraceae bacterium]|nr:aspartate aminotransferase family protein [Leptospiraceae bacterium]MDW8306942.1 aspartate aminotransferase family protein [Leptospiraceae bacterium]
MHEEEPMKREKGEFLENLYGKLSQDQPGQKEELRYHPHGQLSFEEIRSLDEKYILPTYSRLPVSFVYGSGEFLYDSEGREYLDFLGGIAVTSLGHAPADLIESLTRQADMLWHTSNLFYSQQQVLLARALVEINFPGKVFFCNSGTEANEAALKIMRAYGQKKDKHKFKIISLLNSFHGRTFGSMSVTGQEKIHGGFGPLLPGVEYVTPNNTQELEEKAGPELCGIILEPIQGEGGVLPLEKEFIQKARDICDKHSALLCFDEIQTGMGRCGSYFVYQQLGILPDILTMAKGLGGGFPLGAVLVAEKYCDVLAEGMHGSTFGGNHLACAVAYEVIRTMESRKLVDEVRSKGIYLAAGLKRLGEGFPEHIVGIRGLGLLQGIVLNERLEARRLVEKALDEGLVIGRAGKHVLRLAPPLTVRQASIDQALGKLKSLFSKI